MSQCNLHEVQRPITFTWNVSTYKAGELQPITFTWNVSAYNLHEPQPKWTDEQSVTIKSACSPCPALQSWWRAPLRVPHTHTLSVREQRNDVSEATEGSFGPYRMCENTTDRKPVQYQQRSCSRCTRQYDSLIFIVCDTRMS